YGVGLVDARETKRSILKIPHAFAKVLSTDVASAGTGGANRVNHTHYQSFDSCSLDIVMMLFGCQRNLFGCTVFAQHLARNVMVLALHLVRQGFTQIVYQSGIFGSLYVGTQVLGYYAGNVRHFG